jgi:hypothetical protein
MYLVKWSPKRACQNAGRLSTPSIPQIRHKHTGHVTMTRPRAAHRRQHHHQGAAGRRPRATTRLHPAPHQGSTGTCTLSNGLTRIAHTTPVFQPIDGRTSANVCCHLSTKQRLIPPFSRTHSAYSRHRPAPLYSSAFAGVFSEKTPHTGTCLPGNT